MNMVPRWKCIPSVDDTSIRQTRRLLGVYPLPLDKRTPAAQLWKFVLQKEGSVFVLTPTTCLIRTVCMFIRRVSLTRRLNPVKTKHAHGPPRMYVCLYVCVYACMYVCMYSMRHAACKKDGLFRPFSSLMINQSVRSIEGTPADDV